VGDLVAGTWVIRIARVKLSPDLGAGDVSARRAFPEHALQFYGIYELQVLEDVLRGDQPAALASVAQTIRTKFAMPDEGDNRGFLEDFYAALCARLEGGLLLGQRRSTKHDPVT
jgi:hypothetical protein